MRADKYDKFCKIFAKLSDESQDKLVRIAYRLLKTQQFAKHETIQTNKNHRKTNFIENQTGDFSEK